MDYKQTTMVPNIIFDTILKTLSEKELKILLIIYRQTIGWVQNGKRKQRDWISHQYFINKTGLSRKSVSQAINLLIKKNLIIAETYNKIELHFANERKGVRIFYTPNIIKKVKSTHASKQIYLSQKKNVLTTKLNHTKIITPRKVKSTHLKRLTDLERYQQICALQQQQKPL